MAAMKKVVNGGIGSVQLLFKLALVHDHNVLDLISVAAPDAACHGFKSVLQEGIGFPKDVAVLPAGS